MAGLRKAKKYDWKDSNMALFGSDTEKQVKKDSARHELAWKNAGQKTGLQIWRIVKFKVKAWPLEDYGSFYSGDSYIILNTYKDEDSDKLLYDVHFWIGKYSTQDEYGTAAYKTVELDTYLDDAPIQHREVQGHETELFKSYFEAISLLEGGADTGFRSARQETYTPRLLKVHGTRKNIVVKEVPVKKEKMTSDDVFILDVGLEIYQWNGSKCNKDEKFKAVQYVQTLKSDRNGRPKVKALDEISMSDEHPFYKILNELEKDDDDDDDDIDQEFIAQKTRKSLLRLTDASGTLEFSELTKDGSVKMSDFKSEDVFILDTQSQVFVWVGNGTSENEKKNGIPYAHAYLMKTDHPCIPITVIKEGQLSKEFNNALDG